jgi:ATP-dependent Lon protease
MMPLSIGRPSSIAAIEAAIATQEKELAVIAQREPAVETPGQNDLYTIGTKAIINQVMRRPDGQVELLVLGTERVKLLQLEPTEAYFKAQVQPLPPPGDTSDEVEALHRAIFDLAAKALALIQPQAPVDLGQLLTSTTDPLRIVYLFGAMLSLELEDQQALLEAPTRLEALRLMHARLAHEVQVLELRYQIASQAQDELNRQQREYLLRQQLQTIQSELGEQNPEQAEAQLLRQQLLEANLPEEARTEVERELSRMEKLPSAAPDYHISRTYLELVLELPWHKSTEDVLDLARARQVLDEDHFDLKEIKERIMEHLGVLKLNPSAKAPILCFVGPPGVGKTSLGQSIARALGRKFERLSLGGLHDEAELRGHRRTYVGAMPGRIIQAIRRAGVNNPVLMLDEVDKLGRDFRGDPAAALLEILDPEQNCAFHDNYLDLPFDLSRAFFITTANTTDTIPAPLLDRMEMLRLPGYSEEEKSEIARRYLIPRQVKEAGLKPEQYQLTDEALLHVITRYTREAGVRQLERAVGRLARKIALRVAEGQTEPVTITPDDLAEMLGPERFFQEQTRQELPPGVATGLAWTEAGGDVLYIEATLLPSGRGLTLTGHLGEVMQESAKAAQSYLWSHADTLGIDQALFRRSGLHLHVPAGAIPKDGPSAGVTMAAALASIYTQLPVRSDTAMTGEITLTGLVLPIGGIKEKVLAARRAELQRVILPKENEKDLREIPEHVRAEMEFIPVSNIEDVLRAALPELTERLAVANPA